MSRLLAVSVGAACAFGASASLASARTTVSLNIPATTDAATATHFTYATHGVPAPDRVVLQRQEGTARTWRTVVGLHRSRAASGTLPALPLGRYRVRIAIVTPRRRVLAERQKTLQVFGDVPFSKLFATSDRGLGSGVYATAGSTFPFVMGFYDGAVNFTAFTVASNPCRSVHLTFVTAPPGQGEDLSRQQGTVTLVQQSADPITTTSTGGDVGALDATVRPSQTWAVNLAQVPGGGSDFLFTWYLNGSASCDATTLTASSQS